MHSASGAKSTEHLLLNSEDFSYDEGKRLAEAVYSQTASFPVAHIRFPIVLGTDDYTKRLHFHIERIFSGNPIYFPALDSKISFVSAVDAGTFLGWLATQKFSGPMNACSPEPIALRDLMGHIESRLQKKAVYAETVNDINASPFGIDADWYMNTQLAQSRGFEFMKLSAWLPKLTDEISSYCK
jgi:nucleoside-diphosphate-sugar epimerase